MVSLEECRGVSYVGRACLQAALKRHDHRYSGLEAVTNVRSDASRPALRWIHMEMESAQAIEALRARSVIGNNG